MVKFQHLKVLKFSLKALLTNNDTFLTFDL